MSDGEKLHKILGFMSKVHSIVIKTDDPIYTHARKSTYTHEQILEAFKKPLFGKRISTSEISRLCAILIMDGLGTLTKKPGSENKIGGTIGIAIDHLKVSDAYTSKKYLQNEKPSFVDSNLIKWIVIIFAVLGFFGWASISGLWQGGRIESVVTPIQTEPKQQKEQSKTVVPTDSTERKTDPADSSKTN